MAFESFSPDDQRILTYAPFWMLRHVAGAGGKVDQTEWEALIARVQATEPADGLAGEVSTALAAAYERVATEADVAAPEPLDGLKRLAAVLDDAPDLAEAQAFKRWLLAAGASVAESSAGFLRLGGKISGDERQALREASRALRVLSRRALLSEGLSFRSLIVPLDGTPESEAALKPAVDIAERFGAQVTLLQVATSLQQIARIVAIDGFVSPTTVEILEEAEQEEVSDASAYLRAVRRTVGQPEWRTVVREGDAAQVILEEAAAAEADLIVMTTLGDSVLRKVFHPSVASSVVARSRVPVLVIHID